MLGVGMRCLLWFLALAICPALALAGPTHDLAAMRNEAALHLRELASQAFADARISVDIDAADPRLRLPHCGRLVFFLPAGSHPWGSGNLGVRCESPAWSLYLTYRIRLRGPALVARQPLPANQALTGNEAITTDIEYTGDPRRYPRDPGMIRGTALIRPVTAGSPISIDMLRREPVIRAGQRVRIIVDGGGFLVGQEGIAQQQAFAGDSIRLKTTSGRQVQGVAQPDGTVRVRP